MSLIIIIIIIITDERNELGGGRHVLGDEQHEDGVGEQDGDAERDLLTGVRRQTERQQTEHVQRDARQNYVEHITCQQTNTYLLKERQRELLTDPLTHCYYYHGMVK